MEQIIRIRVSAADKTAFEEAARAMGLSLSAWSRLHLMAAAKPVDLVQRLHQLANGSRSMTDVYGLRPPLDGRPFIGFNPGGPFKEGDIVTFGGDLSASGVVTRMEDGSLRIVRNRDDR